MTTEKTPEHNRAVNTPTDTPSPGLSKRVDQAASWIGWHLGELAGIGVPLVLAATVNGWFTAAAMVVAGCWLTHEIRQARRRTHHRRARLALPSATPDHDHRNGGTERGVPRESA